ncbi:hypothetical protein KAW96_10475 [candidate division WOR-3 bacterium]|nr:hypothetical protein [candidate division WOR-3 bacterium]
MKLKIMCIGVLLILLLLLLSLTAYSHNRKKLTDKVLCRPTITEEGKISALLCCLAQDVKEQRVEMFPFYFTYPFTSEEKTYHKINELMMVIDTLFKKSKKRENDKLFIRKTPYIKGLISTWDFQINDIKINIVGEIATVKCNLIFYAAHPDTTDVEWKAPGRRAKANFTLVKRDNEWRISRIDKLFSFIEDVIIEQTSKKAKFDRRQNFVSDKSERKDILMKGGGER